MNNITVAGTLGRDAELKSLGNGDQVLSFSVADSQGRDKPTIWWNCQLWGKRAASLEQYLVKGQQVTVTGGVSEREWTDKDGQKRKVLEVRVNDLALQGGKTSQEPRQATPAPRKAAQQRDMTPRAVHQQADSHGFDDMDDDIPF